MRTLSPSCATKTSFTLSLKGATEYGSLRQAAGNQLDSLPISYIFKPPQINKMLSGINPYVYRKNDSKFVLITLH
jgi:hypothetical protein